MPRVRTNQNYQEVNQHDEMKREPDSIWNRVREDRDVDDLIFGEEFSGYREKSQPCSER